jgi:hypothetical protein
MALPSLVSTMPPIGSRSILSMDLGPRVVRTMSDTAYSQRDIPKIVSYSSGLDVSCLGLSALLTLSILVENVDWRS